MDPDYARWIAAYGPVAVMAINAASCLGAPIPALVVMLAAGAWVAQTDAGLMPFLLFGYAGAVAPGLVVFWAGRRFGPGAVARLETRPVWGRLIARAGQAEARWGGAAVFLGSSFAAQVGPAINLLAGAAGMSWRRFHPGHLAGRAIWVGGYTGLGFLFADNLDEITRVAARFSGVILAILLICLAFAVWRVLRKARR